MINEVIPDQAEFSDVRDASKRNFSELMKTINKMGVNLLLSENIKSTQAVTSTSYIDLTSFKFQVRTSGGFVIFYAGLYSDFNTNSISYRLLIDDFDVTQRETIFGIGASGTVEVPLIWCGNLSEGSHVLKIQAKVNGGTITAGSTTYDSPVYAIEFMRG